MSLPVHTVEVPDGFPFVNSDRAIIGTKLGIPNIAGANKVSGVTVTNPGSFRALTAFPAIVTGGFTQVATLEPVMKLLSLTPLGATGGGQGYLPGDTVRIAGGTPVGVLDSNKAVFTVNNVRLFSGVISAGGSGYAVGNTIILAGGTNTTPVTITVAAVSGGAVTDFSITTKGSYSVVPTTLTQASTSGSGTGFILGTLSWGVDTLTVTTPGAYVSPSAGGDYTQDITSGSGTGFTSDDTTLWGLLSVNVINGGLGYTVSSTFALDYVIPANIDAVGTLQLSNNGVDVTTTVEFPAGSLPSDYGVFVNPGQACTWYVPQNSKTNSSFDVVLVPKDSNSGISAGTFDVLVAA